MSVYKTPDNLTAREKDVLRLIATGKTNKEIARQLGLSIRTVEHRVTQILRKLGLRNRTEIAIWVHNALLD